jgi:hypothetical protein
MGQAASSRRNHARRLSSERTKGVLWHHASVNLVKTALDKRRILSSLPDKVGGRGLKPVSIGRAAPQLRVGSPTLSIVDNFPFTISA